MSRPSQREAEKIGEILAPRGVMIQFNEGIQPILQNEFEMVIDVYTPQVFRLTCRRSNADATLIVDFTNQSSIT